MENENKETELELETFDEVEFFDKEIQPKMLEVLELCRSRRIPVLMNAIKKVSEDGCQVCHISAIDNRNGQGVSDLACVSKILAGKKHYGKSMVLKAMAAAEEE